MFVTHAHTDHILGAVWMVRIVMQKMLSGQYTGTFRVYGHDKVLEVLDWICRKLLPAKIVALIGSAVEFREVKDGETFEAGGLCLQCFDIASTKEKQFGFRTQLPDGQSFVCLGDEPYNVINRSYVEMRTGFYAKPFACMRIGKFSNLIRSTTVRHWTPGDWLRNWE